jgi:hypothetical protein
MQRYLSQTPRKEYPEGVRIVHNFYPGPHDDPGRDRGIEHGGFRVWVTDEPDATETGGWGGRRCYCGWLGGREHYGTVTYIDAKGNRVERGVVRQLRTQGTTGIGEVVRHGTS